MTQSLAEWMAQIKQNLWLTSPNRAIRTLIFEYALLAALLGLNPWPNLFSLSLILVGLATLKLMRDIGTFWGYPRGQDILAIAGNLFGGVGALAMAFLAWILIVGLGILLPATAPLALSAACFTFTWVVGQATTQYYETGQARETQDITQEPLRPIGIAGRIGDGAGSPQRRKVLLGLLATGGLLTSTHKFLQVRELQLRQTELGKLAQQSDTYVEQYLQTAFSGDTVAAQKIQSITNSMQLTDPKQPYNRQMSKLLIRCNRLGTEQYLKGTIVSDYDGSIVSLPSFDPRFAGYIQVKSLVGPEEATTTRKIDVTAETQVLPPDPLRENLEQLQNVVEGAASQVVVVKWLNPVYWGFVLTSSQHSIISFRGTQQTNEWIQNVLVQQLEYTDLSPFKFIGKVHHGFATIYGSIAQQVVDIAKSLDKTLPVYVTGHSLGASLATLAAMDLAIQIPSLRPQLHLYTYASPRVGDVAFARAHNRLVPNHYRVVNVADAIPLAPPTITPGLNGQMIFAHTGQLWGFVEYAGDVAPNHFISAYKKAIDQDQETLQA